MNTVEWTLSLKDKVSPVGKRVETALTRIKSGAGKLADKGLKLASKGVEKLREKINDAAPAMLKWAAIGTLAAGAGLAFAGTKLAIEAQKFKDSTLIATKALLKSDQLAGTAYKRMLDFANYFGGDPTEAIEKFNSALAKGFSARDAEKLLQAFGDLKLVTPNINIDSLTDAFGNIRKKGKLELADFEAAVSAGGLNLTLAYEAIGKKIGKNAKEVEMLIGSGRVNAKVGLVGLLDAINQRTNSKQVGERLNEYANTTSGLMERLKNLPQQFMLRLTADDSPIKGTLKKLLEYLDPDGPNGKKIIGALNTAFTKIGEVLKDWATPEGIEKLSKGITQVIEAAPKVIKAIGVIAGAVLVIDDAFSSFTDNCRFLWAEFKRGSLLLGGFAAVSLAGINPVLSIGVAVYSIGKTIADAVPKIWAWLSDLGKKAATWGSSIADGLWTGLKSAWKGLLEKIKGLVDLLPDAVKKTLGIASPAKAMMPIGKFSAQGIGVGFEQEAPRMTDSIVSAIDVGRMAATTAASSVVNSPTSNLSSSSSSRSVSIGQVIFGDASSRTEQRNQLRELQSMIERAALA
jgi:hypothetical protein